MIFKWFLNDSQLLLNDSWWFSNDSWALLGDSQMNFDQFLVILVWNFLKWFLQFLAILKKFSSNFWWFSWFSSNYVHGCVIHVNPHDSTQTLHNRAELLFLFPNMYDSWWFALADLRRYTGAWPLRVQDSIVLTHKFLKHNCLRSQCPQEIDAPPYGKSWICHWFE